MSRSALSGFCRDLLSVLRPSGLRLSIVLLIAILSFKILPISQILTDFPGILRFVPSLINYLHAINSIVKTL
jgi:hypothetical protein